MVGEARIPCCVPFCRRWRRGREGTDFICRDHWTPIPLARRRAYQRAYDERLPHPWGQTRRVPRWMGYRPERTADSRQCSRPRNIRAIWRLWRRLRRIAIERAL